MRLLRVLIVEDDKAVALVTRGFVERHGAFAVVGEAGTGRDALEAIEAVRPDLVLLDVHLPDASGIEVLRVARARGFAGEVVAVTAARDLETVRAARAFGVRHYLVKPFGLEAMRERLEAIRAELAQAETLSTHPLDQRAVDAMLQPSERQKQPVAGSQLTLDRVAALLAGVEGSVSATEVAEQLGMARVSARRYLERLVIEGRAAVAPRYGGTGRPELRYSVR
ncbi:response regulator [Agrococcus sp. ARC_14]|uniref:response regulator n=1 Tax=Agrococcus sp. ARC_14 TaxID=2919927 RepID=UPI001F066016|nr:response regulator [Agrococcus sp. ARC_14]MCH1884264.1 response regulator [Agrococcus sp. ARC_14]